VRPYQQIPRSNTRMVSPPVSAHIERPALTSKLLTDPARMARATNAFTHHSALLSCVSDYQSCEGENSLTDPTRTPQAHGTSHHDPIGPMARATAQIS
jgi:hypothetical protein